MLIEALMPLKVRVNDRELFLDPGRPQELSDDEARRLLAKVPDKVRIVSTSEPIMIEPAIRSNGTMPTAIYWEDNTGRIVGPAIPEFVAKADGVVWIVTTYGGWIRWVSVDRLRNRQAFEAQPPIQVVELIREWL